jgi:hypothetical protein
MTSEANSPAPARPFPAQVVRVLGYGAKVVINRGSTDGVKLGSRFLVYALSDDEIVDPETGQSLGRLEIVRGRGVVTHVQPQLATIEPEPIKSTARRTVKRLEWAITGRGDEIIEEPTMTPGSFEEPQAGDRAKPV